MASTIASQLQAIKTLTLSDSEPLKRPFTRPSIIFDPKEAADIDIDSIFAIALSGKIDSILTSFSGKFFGSWRWLANGFLMVCLFGKEEKEGKIGTFLFRVLFGCLSNIFPKNKHDDRQLWLVLFSSHPLCFVRKFLPEKLKMGDECFLVAKGTERKIGMFYFGLVCYWWKWNFWGTEQQKDSRKGFSSKLDWKGTIGFPTKIPLLLMDNISWKISQESWICMINGGLSALFGCKDKKRREKWNILFSVNFVLMGVKL